MEVNVDMLEQMDLMDVSDQEALDVFLNSGGEENTAASPATGTVLHPPRHRGSADVYLRQNLPYTSPSNFPESHLKRFCHSVFSTSGCKKYTQT